MKNVIVKQVLDGAPWHDTWSLGFKMCEGVKVTNLMFDLKVKESEGLKVRRFMLEMEI